VCSAEKCQQERKRRNRANWRASRPDYWTARRIEKRGKAERAPEPLRVGGPLDALPWDILQDELGVKAADFVAIVVRIVLRMAQSQSKVQPLDSS
jgi:hypothetical protein